MNMCLGVHAFKFSVLMHIVKMHYTFTISSSNILLDENYNAKVSDFGFCVQLDTSSDKTIFTAIPGEGMPGTRGYIAPECCDGKFSMKSDVYSYGIVRYYSQCPHFTKLKRNSLIILFLQVCLETFSGLLAYSTEREDCKLVRMNINFPLPGILC